MWAIFSNKNNQDYVYGIWLYKVFCVEKSFRRKIIWQKNR